MGWLVFFPSPNEMLFYPSAIVPGGEEGVKKLLTFSHPFHLSRAARKKVGETFRFRLPGNIEWRERRKSGRNEQKGIERQDIEEDTTGGRGVDLRHEKERNSLQSSLLSAFSQSFSLLRLAHVTGTPDIVVLASTAEQEEEDICTDLPLLVLGWRGRKKLGRISFSALILLQTHRPLLHQDPEGKTRRVEQRPAPFAPP